jgi:hypothetical protein
MPSIGRGYTPSLDQASELTPNVGIWSSAVQISAGVVATRHSKTCRGRQGRMWMRANHACHHSARTSRVYPRRMHGNRRTSLIRTSLRILIMTAFMCTSFYVYQVRFVYSGEMTDDMQQMQKQLNNEVMSKPFSVADEAQVKAYIEGAQKRGEVPQPYHGEHWRPGYTCIDLRPYSSREYLSCRYYYYYYGHYYR